MENPVFLRWEGLAKVYGPRTLFSRIDGEAASGRVVAVVGPNGSGKSTFVKILAGVLRPSVGQVRWNDAALDGRRRVGFASPYLNLYGELTAVENLDFFSRIAGEPLTDAEIRSRLEEVGLKPADHAKLLRSFSSGMIQRARLAFARLAKPAVLFLDEPGSNLDDAGREVVRQVVALQRREGATIIATNDPEEAALADARVALG